MKYSSFFLLGLSCLCLSLPTVIYGQSIALDDLEDDGTELNVLIGYKQQQQPQNDQIGNFAFRLAERRNKKRKQSEGRGLARVNAVKASLNRTVIRELQRHDDILYVEEDHKVQMLREIRTPSLKIVEGLSKTIPKPSSSATGACSDPNSFKIGIVDSGIDVSHPDLPCANMGTSQATCIGDEFGIPSGQYWDKPTLSHGTMVAGIISAIRGNNQGISGVLDNSKVCLIMARVFADSSDGSADLSSILDGIYWVYEQGAKVINLSLGGPSDAVTAKNLYQSIRDSGVLLVAAAGNDGSSTKSYPASYSSCISVGAVDNSLNRASFSQYNNAVDIAAPGVHILSTSPLGVSALASVSTSNSVVFGGFLVNSPLPSGALSGPLVNCPNLGKSTCPGSSGQVCLIERGDNYFEDKALNCQAGGGIAAVIYNNVDFDLTGAALSTPTSVTIPVISLSMQNGQTLLNNDLGKTVTINTQDGYEYGDGTSFSAPYVAGGAASIWQACPRCSADQVEQCLMNSARDLGTSGVDDYYGHGLLQVAGAYSCLVNSAQCCDSSTAAQASSPAKPPTPAPARAPVAAAPAPTAALDCSSEQDAYASCFANQLSAWEEELCRYCVNTAVPYNLEALSCSSIDSTLCPAITNTCAAYCGSCVSSIETYMSCAVTALRSDCKLECNVGASGMTTGGGEQDAALDTSTSSSSGSDNTVVGIVSSGGDPTPSPSHLRSSGSVVSLYHAGALLIGLAVLML